MNDDALQLELFSEHGSTTAIQLRIRLRLRSRDRRLWSPGAELRSGCCYSSEASCPADLPADCRLHSSKVFYRRCTSAPAATRYPAAYSGPISSNLCLPPVVNQPQASYYPNHSVGGAVTSATSSPAQQTSGYYGYQQQQQQQQQYRVSQTQQPLTQQSATPQQTGYSSSYYQHHTPAASAAPPAKATPTATPPASHQGVGYGSSPSVAALPSVAYPSSYSSPYYSATLAANRSDDLDCHCTLLVY